MKKMFVIEVEYEPTNGDVLYDVALEAGIENFMEGYVDTKSIKKEFNVNVEEI